ncbi:Ldh family oxidoreductase, partial [Candidatus Bathyarchaeota archaeon]|nr:Ldh family oxidoreductase [Candidatus Bathyarchaeota archaeon]
MVRVREKHLRELCNTMFKAADVPESEAKIVSEILVDTSIHGVDSHGVSSILGGLRALPDYITRIKNKKFVPNAPIKILVDTPTTAMWDAGLGFGFVAGAKAMKAAIKKAKKYKMGSVGIMGSGAIGGLWWYSYQAAKNNMI